jgi:proteasome lid subunit RPN8/RPN11
MGTALSSVAFGGLLGGLLHPGIGAVGEALTGKLPDWAAQIDGLPTKIQEAAGRGALVDTLNGDPPDAEPLINTGNAFRTIDETPQVLQGIAERFDNENTPPTEEEQRALMGYGRDDTPPDFGQGVNDEIEKILGLQQEKGLEHAAFFDPFSNSFLNFDYSTQTRNQVNLPGSIVELAYNPHEALGILHTHPDENSLSDADLNTSSFPGVGYIAAHTPGGETFIGKYTGDPKRLAENYNEAVDKVTNFFSDLFYKGYFGPRSEEAGLRFSFKVTDVINRVLAYGGLLDYASTAGLTPEETEWLSQIGREIYGDEGNSGIARSTRQLARHEAVGELLRRSEEAAATRPGSRLRDSRRAAYDKAFAELKKQIAAEAPPEIGPDDFMAMSADQKAAYFYQVMKASGLSKDDLPEFSSQILDMVEQARQSAEQGAQRLAQNATPKQSDADVSAKRELLRRIQEAPEISGRPEDAARDQATAEKLNADFADFVAGEKAAGRWTEDDDKALASIQQDEERTLASAELCRSLGNCIAGGS